MLFKKHHTGFTLIELLVALGILGFVMVAVNNLFFSTIKVGKKTDIHVKLKEDGAYALNFMATKIRNAKNIESASCGESIQIREEDSSLLTFNRYTSGTTISRIRVITKIGTNPSVTNYLTNTDFFVQSLSISCPSSGTTAPRVVTINFTLRYSAGTESENFQTQVSLRNY